MSLPDDTALEFFLEALSEPEDRFSLFHSALRISPLEHSNLHEGWEKPWLRRFHEMVSDARRHAGEPAPLTPRAAIKRLALFFCQELQFTGDQETYHAPANSCMTDVMENRRGLPISLSVLLIAIGRRLGMDIFGIAAPGHFLTGVRPTPEETIYIDPFNGPELLTADVAALRVGSVISLPADQILPFLTPAEDRQILMRMLNNLKNSYRQGNQPEKMLRAISWIIAMDPGNLGELRNRGMLRLHMGEAEAGARDLLHYVESAPEDEEELSAIREQALRALSRRSGMN